MPTEWLKQIIGEVGTADLLKLVRQVQTRAGTSVMACFYALENALPSGHLFLVRNKLNEFPAKFLSEKTFISSAFLNFAQNENLLDGLCLSKTEFSISQYEVIHYTFQPCLDKDTVAEIYEKADDILECLNILSDYSIEKSLFNLQYFLECIHKPYIVYVYYKGQLLKQHFITPPKIKIYCSLMSELIYSLELNSVIFQHCALGNNYDLVIVEEENYEFPNTRRINPNILLKQIVNEIYTDNFTKYLHSINGVVSHINSNNKSANKTELYNYMKYRFICDEKFVDFYNHINFDLYLTNKIYDMIENRK